MVSNCLKTQNFIQQFRKHILKKVKHVESSMKKRILFLNNSMLLIYLKFSLLLKCFFNIFYSITLFRSPEREPPRDFQIITQLAAPT